MSDTQIKRRWTIVSGSHRPKSESGRVALFIKARAQELFSDLDVSIIDLGKMQLPFWDERMWTAEPTPEWVPISQMLKASEALIVVSAEWAGMVPAALKNFFLYCGKGDLTHKPGMIVGVSSGPGGAYPVAELRASSYKNSHLCYIPEQLVIRHVEEVFKSEEADAKGNDQYLRNRLKYSLTVLNEYAKALGRVRESGVLRPKDYPFGM